MILYNDVTIQNSKAISSSEAGRRMEMGEVNNKEDVKKGVETCEDASVHEKACRIMQCSSNDSRGAGSAWGVEEQDAS